MVRSPPPPHTHTHTLRTEKQLTARADRPVRDPAHTVAFTTAVAIGGARSVHRQTGMLAARVLPGDRNRPAKAVQGIGMARSGRWQPVVEQTAHPFPGQPGLLTAPPHRPIPEPTNPEAEQAECAGVRGHPVVTQVPTHNRAQPASHLRDRIVQAPPKLGLHLPQLGLQPLPHRLPEHRTPSVNRVCDGPRNRPSGGGPTIWRDTDPCVGSRRL